MRVALLPPSDFPASKYRRCRNSIPTTMLVRHRCQLNKVCSNNGAGAGISDLYYPSKERTWTKTGQKWATQVALDGIFNVMKEFWPDIRHHLLHQ